MTQPGPSPVCMDVLYRFNKRHLNWDVKLEAERDQEMSRLSELWFWLQIDVRAKKRVAETSEETSGWLTGVPVAACA